MATVKNTALIAVELPSGALLPPGQTATGVDLKEISTQIDEGHLVEVKTRKPRAAAQADDAESKENSQ